MSQLTNSSTIPCLLSWPNNKICSFCNTYLLLFLNIHFTCRLVWFVVMVQFYLSRLEINNKLLTNGSQVYSWVTIWQSTIVRPHSDRWRQGLCRAIHCRIRTFVEGQVFESGVPARSDMQLGQLQRPGSWKRIKWPECPYMNSSQCWSLQLIGMEVLVINSD